MLTKKRIKIIVHYLFIYCLIISQGSVIYNKYQDGFVILIVIITSIFLLFGKKVKLSDKNIKLSVGLLFVLLFTMIITNGSLSIFSVGNVISKFLIVFLVYWYDKKNAATRYVKAVVFFSVVSLFVYILQISNYGLAINILGSNGGEYSQFHGGLFATIVDYHSTRNIGLATEPGRHQVYLIPALYIILYKNEQINFSKKAYLFSCIVLIITIITAQSTTGYLALIILLAGFFVNPSKVISKKAKNAKILIFVFTIIAIIYINLAGSDTFVYTNFINKLFNSSGDVNLYASTGGARMIAMQTDIKMALEHPLGMGYTNYQDQWISNLVGHTWDRTSCVGITISCAALGFPATLIILWYYILNGYKNAVSIIEFLVLLALLINTSLAQPMLYFPPIMFMFIIEKTTNRY